MTYPLPFCKLVQEAIVEIAETMGVDQLQTLDKSQPIPESEGVGMIVFMGAGISGGFAVHCSPAFLDKTNPAPEKEAQKNDWKAEVANRFLGGVKARAAMHKVDFEVSVPKIITYDEFKKASKRVGPIKEFFFTHDCGNVSVSMFAEIGKGIDFASPADPNQLIGGPGQAVVF